jgi:hypothetical protein
MNLEQFEKDIGCLVLNGAVAWFFAQMYWVLFKRGQTPTRMDIVAGSIIWFFILMPIRWLLFYRN